VTLLLENAKRRLPVTARSEGLRPTRTTTTPRPVPPRAGRRIFGRRRRSKAWAPTSKNAAAAAL